MERALALSQSLRCKKSAQTLNLLASGSIGRLLKSYGGGMCDRPPNNVYGLPPNAKAVSKKVG